MSAEDHQFAYALNIKRSYNVLQNGLLGGITGVNTKRKLASGSNALKKKLKNANKSKKKQNNVKLLLWPLCVQT